MNSSEVKDCYGGEWLLTLYPGGTVGTSTENSEERVMKLRIINKRIPNKIAEVAVIVISEGFNVVHYSSLQTHCRRDFALFCSTVQQLSQLDGWRVVQ